MQKQEDQKESAQEEGLGEEKRALSGNAKYTGVAFQMMAIIGFSALIGYKIDEYYDHRTQWVTAITCVLGVCLSIYQTIRQLK